MKFCRNILLLGPLLGFLGLREDTTAVGQEHDVARQHRYATAYERMRRAIIRMECGDPRQLMQQRQGKRSGRERIVPVRSLECRGVVDGRRDKVGQACILRHRCLHELKLPTN